MLEAFFSGQEVGNEKKGIIQTKNRKKTKIASLLHVLYKDLKPAGTLKLDTDYLKLARVIDCFQDESDVYKAITRTR